MRRLRVGIVLRPPARSRAYGRKGKPRFADLCLCAELCIKPRYFASVLATIYRRRLPRLAEDGRSGGLRRAAREERAFAGALTRIELPFYCGAVCDLILRAAFARFNLLISLLAESRQGAADRRSRAYDADASPRQVLTSREGRRRGPPAHSQGPRRPRSALLYCDLAPCLTPSGNKKEMKEAAAGKHRVGGVTRGSKSCLIILRGVDVGGGRLPIPTTQGH